jgi:hypothetical protein
MKSRSIRDRESRTARPNAYSVGYIKKVLPRMRLPGIRENIIKMCPSECVKMLSNTAMTLTCMYTKKKFKYPETIISSIEDRKVEQSLRCLYNNCNYVCVCPMAMEGYCKTTHGWVTSKGVTQRYIHVSNFTLRDYVDSTRRAINIPWSILPSPHYPVTQQS